MKSYSIITLLDVIPHLRNVTLKLLFFLVTFYTYGAGKIISERKRQFIAFLSIQSMKGDHQNVFIKYEINLNRLWLVAT